MLLLFSDMRETMDLERDEFEFGLVEDTIGHTIG